MNMELLKISRRPPKSGDQDAVRQHSIVKPRRLPRPGLLFLAVVVAPVLLAIVYFGFVASDIYLSESQFVVQSPDKPSQSPLGAILQTAGFSDAGSEGEAAKSFAVSRDALRSLNLNQAFEKAYTRSGISIIDRFNPFGFRGSFEDLYAYFQGKVGLDTDSTTSITTLAVQAYTPQDAYRFNQELLALTEAKVNTLNSRGRQDLLDADLTEVNYAKAKSQSAALALAAYRNRTGLVDPQAEAQAEMSMVSGLQSQLIATQTELAQIERYAPQNPQIPVLRTQVGTIQGQIKEELAKLTGGRHSLAGNSVEFQRLTLESDFADKQLTAALAQYEQARDESLRKQAYIERIVQPNLPDYPVGPQRLRGILATLILSLVAYGILRMLLAGIREHAQ